MSTREERFRGIDRAVADVFPTITGEHWRAMFRRERAGVRNPVAEGIREKIFGMGLGKNESGNAGKTSTGL